MTAEPGPGEPTSPPRSRVRVGLPDVLCIGPIVLHSLYYYATIPLGPSLIGTRPLLLAGLRGSIPALLTVGAFAHVGRVPLWAALVAPILNLSLSDPFFYWAGRRYGNRLLGYMSRSDPGTRRRIARGERLFARYGVWAVLLAKPLPAPAALFYMAAGETAMPFPVFLAFDLAGTLLFIAGYVALGWIAGQHAVDLAEKISQYGLRFTIGLIVLLIAWSMWGAWRHPKEQPVDGR
ncbi:MAG: DedA family protein [Candidatus Dormibacteria bacterium]